MKKIVLLAAMAATVMPGAAIAQQHNARQDRTEVRQGQYSATSDRHNPRTDRRNVSRNTAQRYTGQRNTGQHTRSAYVAPVRNWSYRPVNVGYRLQPSFYGSRYYISDYSAYHLRAPSRWQQWIRYGNDLLLVNIRTGRVLQVIHYAGW